MWKLFVVLMLGRFALAANPQDEQVVRQAYAKLAYAVQAHTVYDEAQEHPNQTLPELTKQLQANELRFEISEMSSGAIADISSRPYSDFVSRPDTQDVLQIVHDEETFNERGKRFTSYFAVPRWAAGGNQSQEVWDMPVKDALVYSGSKYSRYVTATITVRFQGRSRTYHTLWLFGTEVLSVDLVSGSNVPSNYIAQNLYPSVLTDTSLRSHAAVDQWLHSTQRFEASCKTGKQDVCCDPLTMRCGVHSDDLRSTKPAPNTTAIPKEKLQ